MASVGTAYVELKPDLSALAGRHLQSKLGGIGRTAGRSLSVGMAAGAGAAGASLYGLAKGAKGAKASVQAFEQSRVASQRVNAVLKATGGVANVSSKQMDALASSLMNKTAIDDEEIKSAAALLLTFKNVRNELGKGNKVFNRATKAATDLSAAGFGSMDSSAKMLGKALQDPVKGITALSRAGVTFTEQQKEQIKLLVGEGNAIDRLKLVGIALTAEQKAMAMTLNDLSDPLSVATDLSIGLTDAQKQQLTAMQDGSGQLKAQKLIMAEVEGQVKGTAARVASPLAKMQAQFGEISETVGKGLSPAVDSASLSVEKLVRRHLPALERAADRTAQIFNSDLSGSEKWSRLADTIKRELGPITTELEDEFAKIDLGPKLAASIDNAAPKLIESLASHAPAAASAFAKAWMNSDILTRAVLGGYLLKKTGGFGAFRSLGAQQGAAAAAGYRATFTAGTVAAGVGGGKVSGIRGKLGRAGALGASALGGPVGVGITAAALAAPSAIDALTYSGDERAQDAARDTEREIKKLQDRFKSGKTTARQYAGEMSELAALMDRMARGDGFESVATNARELADGVQEMADKARTLAQLEGSIGSLERVGVAKLGTLRKHFKRTDDSIRENLGESSAEAKRLISSNYEAMRVAITNNLNAGVISHRRAHAEIARLIKRELTDVFNLGEQYADAYSKGREGPNPGEGHSPLAPRTRTGPRKPRPPARPRRPETHPKVELASMGTPAVQHFTINHAINVTSTDETILVHKIRRELERYDPSAAIGRSMSRRGR
jgi:hypothetical protein